MNENSFTFRTLSRELPSAQTWQLIREHQERFHALAVRTGESSVRPSKLAITGQGRCPFAGICQDVTELRRSEEALVTEKLEMKRQVLQLKDTLAERTGELHEAIGELEQFSYSLSHDLRAPLRAMQSFASFLADEYSGRLDEQGINYLQRITRSALRLDRLICDVLSYTQVLRASVPMERVDLDRLTRDIIETFPDGHPIKPDIRIEGVLPKVTANEALLAQCIFHLLSNGAKFVSPGTTPRLEISAEEIGKASIRIWFRDNGVGIAPENHHRIFRLFEQVYSSVEYEGTGIGLTIVRKAVERMGARIGFESELDQGSEFWIELKKG